MSLRGLLEKNWSLYLRNWFGESFRPLRPGKRAPSYLHDTPIKAAVTGIETENQKRIYAVNKGSADGMKVGTFFAGEGTEPKRDNLLLVISVEEGSAKLKSPAIFRAADYQIGNTLVTKTVKGAR